MIRFMMMMISALLSFSYVTAFAYSVPRRCSSRHFNVKEIKKDDYNEWMVCRKEVVLAYLRY